MSFNFVVSELQDLDRHDPILDKFETIIQDITVYYTKKLDMLRIKSEQHQVSLEHPIRDIMVIRISQSSKFKKIRICYILFSVFEIQPLSSGAHSHPS